MITNLAGKNAIVTGAADGVGRACALELARSGANIVIFDLDEEKSKETIKMVEGIGTKAIFLKTNLWEYDEVKASADQAIEKMAKIELLVNSGATSFKYSTFAERIDPHDFEQIYKTMMWCRLYPSYALLDHMKENGYGKIVVVTSDAGRTPTPRETYVGSCASGLITAGKCMAMEWARYGIRVNTLCLTIINNSPAMRTVMGDGEAAKVFGKTFERARFGVPEPEDVGHAALFFCSPETDKITGAVFSINGGLSFPG